MKIYATVGIIVTVSLFLLGGWFRNASFFIMGAASMFAFGLYINKRTTE